MSAWTELAPFVVLGSLGSLHCAGMCGGFALAVTGGGAPGVATPRRLARPLAYVVGKAVAYGVLGLIAATGCIALTRSGSTVDDAVLGALQVASSVLAGGLLIAMGALRLGLRVRLPRRAQLGAARAAGAMRSLFAGARGLPGGSGAFAAGVLNGMVPCGLSWSAVLLASQAAPLTAAAGAFVFGLATAPVLIAVGILPGLVSVGLRRGVQPVLGVALVVFGLLVVQRGLEPVPGLAATPECCADESHP